MSRSLNIRLAPHAVLFVLHGCYTAGNGELGAPIHCR